MQMVKTKVRVVMVGPGSGGSRVPSVVSSLALVFLLFGTEGANPYCENGELPWGKRAPRP